MGKKQYDLSSPNAAQYLGVPEQTLRFWRSQRRGPKYLKLPNGKIRYSVIDLDAFLEQHVIDPEGAAA